MASWWRELHFAARSWARTPAVAAIGLLTLALGIGANTAIFTVVDGVLLAPLPLPQPRRFVVLFDSAPALGFPEFASSPLNFRDWREENHVFSGLDALRLRRLTVGGDGTEPEAVAGAAVSGGFFATLGVRPLAGRLLAPEDDRPGGEAVVVLGSDLWHRRFGGDPGVVGRRILVDGVPHTVVGIAPPTFDFPRTLELWVPLALDYAKESRRTRYLHVFGRLKPGVSLGRAQEEMSAIAARLERRYPEENTSWGVVVLRLQDLLVRDVRPALLLLQLAVWVVLLIAATNAASLLLARMGARQRETAVRAALGAGRWRLARQLVAESVVLFAAGGALGLLLAAWATRLLIALNPDAVPRAAEVGVDGRVVLYTLVVSLGTGVVFGLVPAALVVGGPLYRPLRDEGPAVAGSRRRHRLSRLLVLGQVALALVLLVGSGLFLQSLARLSAVDPGFRPRGVLSAQLSLPPSRYPDDADKAAFFQRALERIRSLPGVEGAASIYPLPLAQGNTVFSFSVEGRPPARPGEEPTALGRFVSPGYFRVMGIPRLQGRTFTGADDLRAPPVVVVNRTMAERLWPGRDPLGQRIAFGNPPKPDAEWIEVVGVVGDVRSEELASDPVMELYLPQLERPIGSATLVLRASGDLQDLVPPLRSAIRNLDPTLPLGRVQTLPQVVRTSLADDRFKTSLLAILAALALVLAAIGVYGLVSNAVLGRVHEIGVRTALGARRGELVRSLVRRGMAPVAAGLVAGLAGAYAAGRYLASQLFEVGPADPFTYLGAVLLLTAAALVANWVPARRATRIDPLEALRRE